MTVKILIVGCGAIGGLFAAALSTVRQGHYVRRKRRTRNGYKRARVAIIGKNQRTVRIQATDDPATLKGTLFNAVYLPDQV